MGNDGKYQVIEMAKLFESKSNPRQSKDSGKMKELEDSILEKGVLQPIVVRPVEDKFEIVCGARRYTASKNIGLTSIPACIRTLDDKAVLEIQLIENAQRSDVHPLEEAEGYERLMKQYKYTVEEIADKVGKSKTYVYQRMTLCSLIPECRKMFYDGKLTPSTALLVARMAKDVQKNAGSEIAKGRYYQSGPMNLREAHEHLQRNYMLDLKDVAFSKDDKICPDLGSCATCQKRTGNQDALFPDIKEGDRCTDPGCFNAKRKAMIDRQTEKAKSMGLEVAKSSDVFPHGNFVGNGYKDLNDKNYADKKQRTYREILKGHKKFMMTLAVDNNGVIHEVAKEKDIQKALRELGFRVGTSSRHDGKSVAEERREKEIKDKIHSNIIDEILAKVTSDKKESFWRILARASYQNCYDDAACFIAKRIIPGTKRQDAGSVVKAHLNMLSIEDSKLFMIECFLASQYSEAHADMSKLYGVDEKTIEKKVRTAMTNKKAKAKK